MKGNAARNGSAARREVLNMVGAQLVGVTERSIHDRIRKGMSNEGKGDPRNISLYLVSTWLSQNNTEAFLTSDELIDIVAKDTKLNRSTVKRLFKEIPFKIPLHLKPVKIKKAKKKKPSIAVVLKKDPPMSPMPLSTLEVTVPPREFAYFTKQDQVAQQNKKRSEAEPEAPTTLTHPVQRLLDKYLEQIVFITSQLKGETVETVARKVFNSLTALKITNGKPYDTPLYKMSRWVACNKEGLSVSDRGLSVKISKDTGITRERIRKLLIKYDFDFSGSNAPEEAAAKVVSGVKPETLKKYPQPEILPSTSVDIGDGWTETHFGAAKVSKIEEEDEIENIELDPSVKKQYILSAPGIEIVIKTGGNKVAIALDEEEKVRIPEGCDGMEFESYRRVRHYVDGGYRYCYACKKPFNGMWLHIISFDGEGRKSVPCHGACLDERTKIMFVKKEQG